MRAYDNSGDGSMLRSPQSPFSDDGVDPGKGRLVSHVLTELYGKPAAGAAAGAAAGEGVSKDVGRVQGEEAVGTNRRTASPRRRLNRQRSGKHADEKKAVTGELGRQKTPPRSRTPPKSLPMIQEKGQPGHARIGSSSSAGAVDAPNQSTLVEKSADVTRGGYMGSLFDMPGGSSSSDEEFYRGSNNDGGASSSGGYREAPRDTYRGEPDERFRTSASGLPGDGFDDMDEKNDFDWKTPTSEQSRRMLDVAAQVAAQSAGGPGASQQELNEVTDSEDDTAFWDMAGKAPMGSGRGGDGNGSGDDLQRNSSSEFESLLVGQSKGMPSKWGAPEGGDGGGSAAPRQIGKPSKQTSFRGGYLNRLPSYRTEGSDSDAVAPVRGGGYGFASDASDTDNDLYMQDARTGGGGAELQRGGSYLNHLPMDAASSRGQSPVSRGSPNKTQGSLPAVSRQVSHRGGYLNRLPSFGDTSGSENEAGGMLQLSQARTVRPLSLSSKSISKSSNRSGRRGHHSRNHSYMESPKSPLSGERGRSSPGGGQGGAFPPDRSPSASTHRTGRSSTERGHKLGRSVRSPHSGVEEIPRAEITSLVKLEPALEPPPPAPPSGSVTAAGAPLPSVGAMSLARARLRGRLPVLLRTLHVPEGSSEGGAKLASGSAVVAAWKEEVARLAEIKHPNVARVYGVQALPLAGDLVAISQLTVLEEWSAYGSLRMLLDAASDEAGCPWEVRVRVARDAAMGLYDLHQRGMIHFHVSADNIVLFDEPVQAKVGGLMSLSRLAAGSGGASPTAPRGEGEFEDAAGSSKPGRGGAIELVGARQLFVEVGELIADEGVAAAAARSRMQLACVPPEVLRGQRYSRAGDVYSFGLLMYELMAPPSRAFAEGGTGQDAAELAKLVEAIAGAQDGKRPSVPARSGAPAGWVELMQDCWAGEPLERPDIQEVLEELERMLEEGWPMSRAARLPPRTAAILAPEVTAAKSANLVPSPPLSTAEGLTPPRIADKAAPAKVELPSPVTDRQPKPVRASLLQRITFLAACFGGGAAARASTEEARSAPPAAAQGPYASALSSAQPSGRADSDSDDKPWTPGSDTNERGRARATAGKKPAEAPSANSSGQSQVAPAQGSLRGAQPRLSIDTSQVALGISSRGRDVGSSEDDPGGRSLGTSRRSSVGAGGVDTDGVVARSVSGNMDSMEAAAGGPVTQKSREQAAREGFSSMASFFRRIKENVADAGAPVPPGSPLARSPNGRVLRRRSVSSLVSEEQELVVPPTGRKWLDEVMRECLRPGRASRSLDISYQGIGWKGAVAISQMLVVAEKLDALDPGMQADLAQKVGREAGHKAENVYDSDNDGAGAADALLLRKVAMMFGEARLPAEDGPHGAAGGSFTGGGGGGGTAPLVRSLSTTSGMSVDHRWGSGVVSVGLDSSASTPMAGSVPGKKRRGVVALGLAWNAIGAVGAKHLADAIGKVHRLTNVNLEWNNLGSTGLEALSQALMVNKSLTHLSLSGNKVGDQGAIFLSFALRVNQSLLGLSLRSNGIGLKGCEALAQALRDDNRSLRRLQLGSNAIGNKGARLMAEVIAKNDALQFLILDANGIGKPGMNAIRDALDRNRSLQGIALCENALGPWAGKALGEALLSRKGMMAAGVAPMRLLLGSNELGNKGAAALTASLRNNYAVDKLDLSANKLGSGAAAALTDMLASGSCGLRTLDLRDNAGFASGSAGVDFIFAVCHKSRLAQLTLTNVALPLRFMAALCEGLEVATCPLALLGLKGAGIDFEGAQLLFRALVLNKSLRELDVSHNALTGGSTRGEQEVGLALATALKENPGGLQRLVLVETGLGVDTRRLLERFASAREDRRSFTKLVWEAEGGGRGPGGAGGRPGSMTVERSKFMTSSSFRRNSSYMRSPRSQGGGSGISGTASGQHRGGSATRGARMSGDGNLAASLYQLQITASGLSSGGAHGSAPPLGSAGGVRARAGSPRAASPGIRRQGSAGIPLRTHQSPIRPVKIRSFKRTAAG
eukprot:jgi/Mesvir1/1256/Mv14928-RA.2